MQAAVQPSGAGFATPGDLSAAGGDALDPHVVNRFGDALVAWRRFDGTHWRVQAAARPRGEGLAAPADVSGAGQDAVSPRVAMDYAGNAIAVWRRFDGTPWIVQAAVRPATAPAAPDRRLLRAGRRVGLGPGRVGRCDRDRRRGRRDRRLAWRQRRANVVQAATRPKGAAFLPPADLSAVAPNAFEPRISTSSGGGFVVVWHRFNGSAAGRTAAAGRPALALTQLRMATASFRAARSGPATTKAAASRRAARARELSAEPRGEGPLHRPPRGARAPRSGGCVKPATANRRLRRCTRFVRAPGSFSRRRQAGADGFTFTGRLAARRLAPGRYRLTATATAGAKVTSATVGFRIARRAVAASSTWPGGRV